MIRWFHIILPRTREAWSVQLSTLLTQLSWQPQEETDFWSFWAAEFEGEAGGDEHLLSIILCQILH